MKIGAMIVKIIDFLLVISVTAIICVILLQVLARTPLFVKAPHWTEELSRIIFILIVALGSISATIKNDFVAVDLFTSKLTGKKAIIFNMIIDILLFIFFMILIPASLKFVKLGGKQLSPSLRISMKYVFALILVSIIGMGLAKVYRVIYGYLQLKNYKELDECNEREEEK